MSAKEIVQAAKDKPGTVRVATVPGSMWDYIIEQVEANTGAKFLRVPFQGGGAGVTALLGNNVDVAHGFFAEFRGHLDAGKVAPIGVAGAERLAFLKDMPTLNEALGGNEYLWIIIRFAVVPKGTPADRKAYLGAAVQAAMKGPGADRRVQEARRLLRPALDERHQGRGGHRCHGATRARVLRQDRPPEVSRS